MRIFKKFSHERDNPRPVSLTLGKELILTHISIGIYRGKLQSTAFIPSLVSANSLYSEKSCHCF